MLFLFTLTMRSFLLNKQVPGDLLFPLLSKLHRTRLKARDLLRTASCAQFDGTFLSL